MRAAWPFLSLLCVAAAPRETLFVQVAPVYCELAESVRSPGHDRAVVLIHGLRLHPIHADKVGKASLHEWQKPDSLMVTHLGASRTCSRSLTATTVGWMTSAPRPSSVTASGGCG